MSSDVVSVAMVKKFTLLELHLDDARFSNAVGGTPEEAVAMLEELDAADVDPDDLDADDLEDLDLDLDEMGSSDGSIGRSLGRLAFLVVLAVGIRTVARRMLASDDDDVADDESEDSVSFDLDDRVEA
jgi:hypothetical protein